ncbi:Tetratricopeptide TPR_1 repeat-containing protein [Pseudodesulfovibrio mercurii]|uniref:Tetratricopeptide TPR_1 repeat-containing protein n=1 Tax=Pseudodesulfovibrio mercurii TaxID=641491 RepID=F0JDU8_9BACT|nr:tetratricopeptide repeat protein [Pseudodesulfovibrio mercurii]EGB14630.1 Tetratricopeptide TPR_1 repeat-containing protein [Pseudodesulfovibrio mercurii]
MTRPRRHAALTPFALALVLCLGLALGLPGPARAGRARDDRLGPAQYAAVTEARELMEQGDPAGAAQRLLPVADEARPPLVVLDHLAWAQERAGAHDAALVTYRRAAGLYPNDPGTARNLGILLFNRQRFAEAAPALERAYGLQPEEGREPTLLAMAGSAQARMHRFPQALGLLDRAETTEPAAPVSWTAMSAYCCLRLDRTDAALARCRACARRHPRDPAAWSLLGRVLARHGDPLAAASALETARALRPDGRAAPDEYRELAALYALGHAHAEAARCLAAADEPGTTLRRAELLRLNGRNREALEALDRFDRERAANTATGPTVTPEDVLRAALLRGRILRDLGRTGEAVDGLLASARPPAADPGRTVQRLRGALLLLAGELRWGEGDWTGAARIFDDLAAVPGYADTGASLAEGMRAMVREAALAPAPLSPSSLTAAP